MKPTLTIGNAVVYHGNNLDVLPTLPDNSVDSIVCDPPYELGFMGKKWDSSGIAYSVELWTECMRVLKPGGHLLAFGGSRTWHRLAVAIEDAGFEIRDSIAWLYGSGFPKSMDISKAIDRQAGAQREVITDIVEDLFGTHEIKREREAYGIGNTSETFSGHAEGAMARETLPATDEAKQWAGWGTALKPAFEPVVVARKPLIGTVAENVLTWGVGGLNIDGSRIKTTDSFGGGAKGASGFAANYNGEGWTPGSELGRWPANIILDEYTAGLLDEQSDASRFFYVAKASKKDRNEGLEELDAQLTAAANFRPNHMEKALEGESGNPFGRFQPVKNFHPTVKPTAIMEYLIKLVTPPNGTVLDPFTGSGSTGKAALLNGFKFIGIELTEEYLPIIEGRLTHASQAKEEEESETLF